MLKSNTVSAAAYTRKVKEAARAYKKASARVAFGEGEHALFEAAALCPVLCMRAKSAVKSIESYKFLPAEEGEAKAFALAEGFLENGGGPSEESLCKFLSSAGGKYDGITLALLPEAIFCAVFLGISRRVCAAEGEGLPHLIQFAEKLNFIDFSRVFLAFSASVHVFSAEKAGVFAACDDKTKFKYVSALISLCKKEGRGEQEMASELVHRADALGVHTGELLFAKKAYVPRTYTLCLVFFTFLISLLYFLLCGRDVFAILTLPAAAIACYGMVKELLSVCFKYAGGDGLMRLGQGASKKEKAVVAVMSIITGRESDGELFERLENFYLSEENENRFYAIVCNLPDSDRRKSASDEKIIASAMARIEALNSKYGAHFGIFVRERRYSRSEEKYIGWERKRWSFAVLCAGKRRASCAILQTKTFWQTQNILSRSTQTRTFTRAQATSLWARCSTQ